MQRTMSILNLLLLCLLLGSQLTDQRKSSALQRAFKLNKVVPDVIEDVPTFQLMVEYDKSQTVQLGNELKPSDAKSAPVLVSWPFTEKTLYTLVMVDPDAPSRTDPKYREWLHWLVVNIPQNEIGKGQVVADYRPPGPPKGTRLHRYVFLVYKQAGRIDHNEKNRIGKDQMEGRPQFKIRAWAAKNGLGKPLAGNFFQAQHEG